jgi:hypothetical protein
MAKADLILESLVLVAEELAELRMLMETFDELAGDYNVPSWLPVVWRRVRVLEGAIDALGLTVRRDALPYLADLDRASNGGMGGMPPMVTKVMAGQSAPSRT